jgi:hypothetical protein
MPDRLVTIAHFQDYIEAEMAKQRLEDHDIKSVVVGENSAILLASPAIGTAELQVFESQSLVAKAILESQEEFED